MMRGLTLIELVITIAITLVLLLGLTSMYAGYYRTAPTLEAEANVAHGAAAIADATRLAATQANQVLTSHSFSGIVYTSGTTTAIFELPAVTSLGVVLPSLYDYVGIYASGTAAYQITEAAIGSARAAGTKQLTDALGALSFTYDSSDFTLVTNIIANATTSATVHGTIYQATTRTHVYLRN